MIIVFALTILAGAFLLFQIQPIMGRVLLPLYGGSPAVWTTCLLFFQTMLLAGYAHAHGLSTRLGRRKQTTAHILLLAGSVAVLLCRPDWSAWRPDPYESPILRILLLLTLGIGLPYVMLAATSPLCQRWFNWIAPDKSPYRLYALSNAGSLLALVSYPVLVEPHLTMAVQQRIWTLLYCVFAAGCAVCAWTARQTARDVDPSIEAESASGVPPPSLGTTLEWVGLAAAGSAMLLSTSNQMCLEVASFPFLWVLPLAVYLSTFILCFESDAVYSRVGFGALLLFCGPSAVQLLMTPHGPSMAIQVFAYSAILFTACMCCHGELVRGRPHPSHLTRFYLSMATGGAVGGLLVAVAAPAMFNGFYEYNLAFAVCVALVFLAWFRHGGWRERLSRPVLMWGPLSIYGLVLGLLLALQPHANRAGLLAKTRNFFGVLTVHAVEPTTPLYAYRVMRHGSITHGNQLVNNVLTMEPTTYFGHGSGPDLAFNYHPKRFHSDPNDQALVAGVVGLGTGTIAAYGQPGDRIRFYEINPAVVDAANRFFSYLEESRADIDIVLGDARLNLQHENHQTPAARFDLLILDAYSSDAIPIHLITREAIDVYWNRLNPDGLLVLHISNRYVNLERVARSFMDQDHLFFCLFSTRSRGWHKESRWIVCSRKKEYFEIPAVQEACRPWSADSVPTVEWTDDYAPLWSVMQWWGVPTK
jgi:hypothetical protein